jgi:thiamine biosynthesis protein ThiS
MSQGTPSPSPPAAVTVNGAERRITQPISLAQYLASLSLDPRAVVVEHNGVILRDREAFASLALNAGDVLEILHFVGGG